MHSRKLDALAPGTSVYHVSRPPRLLSTLEKAFCLGPSSSIILANFVGARNGRTLALERRSAKGARHHTSSHTVPLREALTRTSAAESHAVRALRSRKSMTEQP